VNTGLEEKTTIYYQDSEVTLKDVILKFLSFWKELKRQKLWMLFFVIAAVGLSLVYSMLQKTQYLSAMSFMLSENDDNTQDALGPMLTLSFGNVEGNKIAEIARSAKVIHEVLLQETVIAGKKDLLANHIITLYNLHRRWSKDKEFNDQEELNLSDFYFTHSNIDSFTLKEFRGLNEVHQLVAGNNLLNESGIMTINYDLDSDLFRLNVESINGQLSDHLLNLIFIELSKFYTEETVGRTKNALSLIAERADSISNELITTESRLAFAIDRNRGITTNASALNIEGLRRTSQRINEEYSSILRNMNNLELLLRKETPEFIIIDRTFLPIRKVPSMIRSAIIGIIIGSFLGTLFVLGKKTVHDALQS
jgi:hypothetical protein